MQAALSLLINQNRPLTGLLLPNVAHLIASTLVVLGYGDVGKLQNVQIVDLGK